MSPVAQISGVVDSTQSNHMDGNTHINGGGGDGREHSGGGGGSGGSAPSANGHSTQQPQQQPQQAKQENSAASKRTPAQKDAYWFAQGDNTPPPKQQRASLDGPNDLFFGKDDKSSGLSYKDREERLRLLRERQQHEKQQKLEELKEQAAAAQRFREQQENERKRRLDEIRLRDADRRSQVEERKRIIQQAEQDRKEAVLRKNAEREQRLESKRRNEKSNIVFAFGSSTPRMLDPRDSSSNTSFFGSRRATSTTNVHLVETSISRRASECSDMDLSRKRATSAHSLDRKTDDLRMSSSMYEVFHWDDSSPSYHKHPPTTQGTRLTKSRDSSLERKIPHPSALSWVRSSSPQPLESSVPLTSKDTSSAPPSSTSSNSSDKTPTNTSQSRYSVWEFGDNFTALGPANQSSGGSGNLASSSPAVTPTSSTRYSRRTASVFTGAGCTIGGEDLMTRSMTAAIPATAARRRTDLLPAMPSLRDSPGSCRSSPRHRSPGMRSGTVTPNSPSRPTSALSQGSNNSSQVSLRSRTSPRKPRPLSIAGSSLSSADKPRDSSTLSRESRPMERKLSVGSASSSSKPARAKSAGSDRSAPATPARTPAKATTPKKTPSQVKAESAAKKAVEKSKATPKVKSQKTTPAQSPVVESKPLPGTAKEKDSAPPKKEKSVEREKSAEKIIPKKDPEPENVNVEKEEPKLESEIAPEPVVEPVKVEPEPSKEEKDLHESAEELDVTTSKVDIQDANESDDQEKTPAQRAAEKPVTGYATEEEYKAALAEKRRLAREAKEKEQELERQRQLEEEERERKEEEDYIKLMEEQRKAEEERLRKAIEEADKNREEEAKKKEEEEKQRIETERIEQQKRQEQEERLHREEEERQARKSRVAAIMARTRGKGGSNTPTKTESKTPSDESKGFDIDMSVSMTDSMINNLEAVVEAQSGQSVDGNNLNSDAASQPAQSGGVSQTSSGLSAEEVRSAMSKSLPTTKVENTLATSVEQTVSKSENIVVDNVISSVASVKLEEPHINGDSPVPMDTTPTQAVDLLGNFNTTGSDVNTRNHNGVDSTPAQTSQGTDNLGSLDPVNSTHNTTSTTPAASNFEQIIDLGQTKLSNEDAVNSNPPSPFIAFEQNLNKKQSQENTSTVPDLLL